MPIKFTYPAIVSNQYNDGSLWVANFPGLSGCWVEGLCREDVIARAPSVLSEYVSSCQAANWPIPEAPNVKELTDTGSGEVIIVSCFI